MFYNFWFISAILNINHDEYINVHEMFLNYIFIRILKICRYQKMTRICFKKEIKQYIFTI